MSDIDFKAKVIHVSPEMVVVEWKHEELDTVYEKGGDKPVRKLVQKSNRVVYVVRPKSR